MGSDDGTSSSPCIAAQLLRSNNFQANSASVTSLSKRNRSAEEANSRFWKWVQRNLDGQLASLGAVVPTVSLELQLFMLCDHRVLRASPD